MKPTGRLENWKWDSSYNVLWGQIYDDTQGRFPDGTHIHTSSIKLSPENILAENHIIKTKNSFYLLGKPKD